jgi:hypothetical protein
MCGSGLEELDPEIEGVEPFQSKAAQVVLSPKGRAIFEGWIQVLLTHLFDPNLKSTSQRATSYVALCITAEKHFYYTGPSDISKNIFSLSTTLVQNKLECLSLGIFFHASLVQFLRVWLRPKCAPHG